MNFQQDSDYKFIMSDAKREAVPPLISLWGMSGSGKTLSALYMARGIVGPNGCIAVLDTENGRAKFYADEAGGWRHVDMQPPFTPDKYTAGFKFCEDNAADIIIVDSASHVWEGEGGVLDMANRNTGKGLAKWNAPKMAHKRMMNSLMRSPLPVIFCARAKEAVRQVGAGKDMEIISDGYRPIAEKNFIYEMTLALHLTENGRYDLATSKIPKDLVNIFPAGAQVNQDMGEKIQQWLAGGEIIDKESIALRRSGKDLALTGSENYKRWFESLTTDQRRKILPYHDEWKADAREADRLQSESSAGDERQENYLE